MAIVTVTGIIENVIPMLREYGLSLEQIRTIVEESPQRFLDTDRLIQVER